MGHLTQLERIIEVERLIREIGERVEGISEKVFPPEKIYRCAVCGKICKNALGLSGHMRSHGKKEG